MHLHRLISITVVALPQAGQQPAASMHTREHELAGGANQHSRARSTSPRTPPGLHLVAACMAAWLHFTPLRTAPPLHIYATAAHLQLSLASNTLHTHTVQQTDEDRGAGAPSPPILPVVICRVRVVLVRRQGCRGR
jgi:hypothetical protein